MLFSGYYKCSFRSIVFPATLIFSFCLMSGSAGLADEPKNNVIVGAGAHFSWLIFTKLKGELEKASGRTLELHGIGSMSGGVGCNAGIKNARASTPEKEAFGFVCCPLTEEDKKGIIVYPLALESILIVVNKNNPVNNLTSQQVKDIFAGKIINWQEVGGQDKPIVVVARLHCKQRPGHWKRILPTDKDFCQIRIDANNASNMEKAITDIPNAIGHIGSAWEFKQDSKVKILSVDGYTPSMASLKAKTYPFYRRLAAVTNKTPSNDLLKIIRTAQTSPTLLEISEQYRLLPLNE
jgi:phosphate transport system substrate-binding protein